MKTWRMISGLLLAGLPAISPLFADGDTAPPPPPQGPAQTPRFGPFEALVFDHAVLQDVKVENGRIYLKRHVTYIDEAITLRNSTLYRDAYRPWFNGSLDLVSPAHAGHAPNGWSDWVETSANYVEYWMNGRLILHLHRLQP
ncbi:hypothetical protein [Actomonas aquatica]|uniref:GH16 domain-containing protein n=1 Tax=Actomonas aquatica TaxID=2866162 RepID=A0ABZ1C501_9BACT|nr:hypothetical protein [Opitutus sp. WL0086]WRQ86435.1 hypothetical protein K1X11_016590 [Opitutus sp. WL0086]